MVEMLAFAMAVFIGFLLGLFGGGGSMIAVPVFIYILGFEPNISITYSLFVVGSSALIGNLLYLKQGQVQYKTAITFVLPSILAVFIVRKLLLPVIPHELVKIMGIPIYKEKMLMVLFALLMVFSGIQMMRNQSQDQNYTGAKEGFKKNPWIILIAGIVVGILTGLVGSGGGFMIVPSLVLFAGLPLKKAIGTSLMVIGINAAVGFFADVLGGVKIDWYFLLPFSLLAFAGIFAGSILSRKIHANKLKPLFGWFELILGMLIVVKEILLSK